jgi:hypothetical protein
MYYIGLDVHKRTISYCVKDGSGTIHAERAIPATRFDLDRWMKRPIMEVGLPDIFVQNFGQFHGKALIIGTHPYCAE